MDQGKTLLLSTHILKDVEAVCSQVVILHRGKVVAGAGFDEWTRSQAQHFLVQWQGKAENFRDACKNAGWEVGLGENGLFRVILPKEEGPRSVFALADKMEGTIHRFVREETSLEEVFLEAVSKGEPL